MFSITITMVTRRMENGECVLCYMTGAKKNSFSRNLTIIGKQLFIKPFCCSPLFEILFSFLWASVLLHLTNICCSPHHHHLNVLTVESHCHWSCHCCLNLINFASYWTVVNQTSGIQAVDWTSWLWHLGVDLLDAGFGFGNFWVDMLDFPLSSYSSHLGFQPSFTSWFVHAHFGCI